MGSSEFEAAAEVLLERANELSSCVDGTPAQLLHYALTLLPDSDTVGWCKRHEKEHFLDADGACAEDSGGEEE